MTLQRISIASYDEVISSTFLTVCTKGVSIKIVVFFRSPAIASIDWILDQSIKACNLALSLTSALANFIVVELAGRAFTIWVRTD